MFLTAQIDTLSDVKVLEAGFGAQLAQAQVNVTESAAKAVAAVIEADDASLAKFLGELVDAKDQIASIAAVKAQCAAFRKALEIPAPVEPIEPPVVIVPELPAEPVAQ